MTATPGTAIREPIAERRLGGSPHRPARTPIRRGPERRHPRASASSRGCPSWSPWWRSRWAISALFGTRYSILGRPWPYVRRALRIAPPRELEHEYPPRFAQALGTIGLTLATLLFVLGFDTAGWVVAAAVAGLQTVLAVTGYCLGCRLYFLKWWVPAQFQKLARRTTVV